MLASAERELGKIETEATVLDEATVKGSQDISGPTGGILTQLSALKAALRGLQ